MKKKLVIYIIINNRVGRGKRRHHANFQLNQFCTLHYIYFILKGYGGSDLRQISFFYTCATAGSSERNPTLDVCTERALFQNTDYMKKNWLGRHRIFGQPQILIETWRMNVEKTETK